MEVKLKASTRLLTAAAFAIAVPTAASAQTEINIVAFAPGFAWADMFGPSGTDKTDKLRAFEEATGITVNIEFADEETARQKVLLDLVNQTGTYDLVMLGSDGAVQTFSYAGYLEPLDDLLSTATEYFDPEAVYPQFLEANRVDGKLWALTVRKRKSTGPTLSRSSVAAGCASKSPSALRTRTPWACMACRWGPRATRTTSSPERASFAPR